MSTSEQHTGEPGHDGAAVGDPVLETVRWELRATQWATSVSRPLAVTVRVLAVPAALLALAPAPALAVGAWIATGASGWVRIVLVALVLAAVAASVGFAWRTWRYVTAVSRPGELAAELGELLRRLDLSDDVLERLRTVAERGGPRVVKRLRAAWELVTLPELLNERIEELGRARWFVPPAIGVTWGMVVAQVWTAVASWVGMSVLIALRAAGTL